MTFRYHWLLFASLLHWSVVTSFISQKRPNKQPFSFRVFHPSWIIIDAKYADKCTQTSSGLGAGKNNNNDTSLLYSVHVSYEGESGGKGIDIPVFQGESILSALERASASGQLLGQGYLNIPPSDCRRGNCLTCSARHTSDSQTHHLQSMEQGNGLSPHVAETLERRGYVLTCSSTVTGEGVSLTLGSNNQLWDFVYRERLETESAEFVARAAMAKAIRRSAERNILEWAEQTENAYRISKSE